VSLTVFDGLGQWDRDVIEIAVTAINTPPTAAPTATPTTGAAPLVVAFAANATDAEGDTLTYLWSFGDGATAAVANPSHLFAASGTYAVWLTVSDGQASVSASLTIVASSGIELNVTKLDIEFKSRRSALASVELQAELYAAIPAADDVVAVFIDGAGLFAVPFGQFVPVKSHGLVVPGVYKLKAQHLWVQIDFVEGRLSVDAEKVNLTGYDPSNGVVVEVMLGDAMAVDNVTPGDEKADRHYKHQAPVRGQGHRSH